MSFKVAVTKIKSFVDDYVDVKTGKLKKEIDPNLTRYIKSKAVQDTLFDDKGNMKIKIGGSRQQPVYKQFIESVNKGTPAPAPAPEQKPMVKTTKVKTTKPNKSPPSQKEEEEEKEEQKQEEDKTQAQAPKPQPAPAPAPAEPKRTIKKKKPSASTSQKPNPSTSQKPKRRIILINTKKNEQNEDVVEESDFSNLKVVPFDGQPTQSTSSSTSQEQPTMSPDERDYQTYKDIFDALLREFPEFGMSQSVSPPLQLQSEEQLKPKEKKEQFKQTQVENVPRFQAPDIPSNIITTDFKTPKQLNDDIKYFFSNFGGALKDEQARYKKISKTNKKLVTELHKRITAKLGAKSTGQQGKNIGVVIDGKDYIKQAVNEILLTQSASKLKPEDLIINITDEGQQRDKDLKDIGTYETKGARSIQKEPIYQFIPTDNSNVYKENKKPVRITKLAMPKTRAENYKEEYRNDAFATKPKDKPVRLKYLY